MSSIKSQIEATPELLTPEQAAELLQVSKRTMYEWLRNGEIPSVRIGERLIRVRQSDVLTPDVRAFFEQGCKLAQEPETVNLAEESFRKAIKMNPHYALAYAQMGYMFAMWGHYHRAIEPLEKAVELNPSFSTYVNLGQCYNNMHNIQMYRKAENFLRAALELRVVDLEPIRIAELHFQLGFSVYMIGLYHSERMSEAGDQFRRSLEISPNYRSAHFLGQIFLFHIRDYDKALLLADEIQEIFPNESEHLRKMVDISKSNK